MKVSEHLNSCLLSGIKDGSSCCVFPEMEVPNASPQSGWLSGEEGAVSWVESLVFLGSRGPRGYFLFWCLCPQLRQVSNCWETLLLLLLELVFQQERM